MVPHEGCGEVLRDACAFTLGDKPLASAVEHGPMELWVEVAEVSIPLHHFIDSEIWEQPTRRWQDGIQQLFKHPVQGHLPLSCLGLQQPYSIGPNTDKPSQISFGCDVSMTIKYHR